MRYIGEITCPTCAGDGGEYAEVCRGGSDHAGHNCYGAVCGSVLVGDCPECEGTGKVLCELCGDAPAIVELDGDAACADCVMLEVAR